MVLKMSQMYQQIANVSNRRQNVPLHHIHLVDASAFAIREILNAEQRPTKGFSSKQIEILKNKIIGKLRNNAIQPKSMFRLSIRQKIETFL